MGQTGHGLRLGVRRVKAAQLMAVAVRVLTARNGNELDNAFATLAQLRVDGLLVISDPVFFSVERERLGVPIHGCILRAGFARMRAWFA